MLHAPLAIGKASEEFTDQRTVPIPAIVGETTADISFIIDYENEEYVGFGTKVFKWVETSGEWSALEHTLPAVAKSAIVTRLGSAQTLYLIVACGDTGYSYFDGTDWVDVTNQKADFLVWWDYMLWSLDSEGQLAKAEEPSGTWTDDAWLPLPDESATALFTGQSLLNTQIIYVVSTDGSLWSHDATNQKFIKTSLDLPVHPDTGVGTSTWVESIYIPSGLAIYKVDIGQRSPVECRGP